MYKVKRLIENHIIFKTNIEEEVFNIKNSVIDNILKERNLFLKNNTGEFRNFTLKKTIYTNKLYNIFKTIVKKTFNQHARSSKAIITFNKSITTRCLSTADFL